MVEAPKLTEEEMQLIYNWVDEIPLSRPKRNIARDFSDGGKCNVTKASIPFYKPHSSITSFASVVLVAEIIKHFIPHIVELHNYSAAHSVSQKTYNWNTLNQKLFKKLGFTLVKKDIEDAVNCVPDTIERILHILQAQIAVYHENKARKMSAAGGEENNEGVHTFAPMLNNNNNNKENHGAFV